MGGQSDFALELLKSGARLASKFKSSLPFFGEQAANTADMIVDAPKIGLEAYANEFRPTPKQINNLQDAKDFIGSFSNAPFAPPLILGRGAEARGYLPVLEATRPNGGLPYFDRPIPGVRSDPSGQNDMLFALGMINHNRELKNKEQEQNSRLQKPFEDWEALHGAVRQRYEDTVKFQAGLRKDPAILKAAGGDPRKLASIIHNATIARNNKLRDQGKLYNAADSLRGYRFYKDPTEPRGSMKSGNMIETGLDLPDMTGRRPYIIR